MRNLKKFLALALAMVMAFSLMMTAGAISYDEYPDKDDVTAQFVESVQVLTGLKVFQGDSRGFRPSDKITRAEAAAIIYRMATGDVEDRQTELYKDYGTFNDVNPGDWFAGYVGYCQNAGYIKGDNATTFRPYGEVTGYEVLAMILRVVGYGKNNEFTGSAWQVNVASMARELGVTKNVTSAHMEDTLGKPAPREVVADLIFMTAAIVPTVTYTPALAYNDKQSISGTTYNPTLGQQTFGLWYDTAWDTKDDWGRPGYSWYKGGAWNGSTVTTAATGKAYMVKDNHPVYTGSTANEVATIMAVPDYEKNVQVRECDVAEALKISVQDTFDLYVNHDERTTDNYLIVATDTVTKVGGQGRITEFYYKSSSPWFTNTTKRAVMVDTMLARVNVVNEVKLDRNDHVITPAQLEVTLYDGPQSGAIDNANICSSVIITKGASDKTNWDYAKGDYILLNAYTTANDDIGQLALEMNAFTTNKVDVNGQGFMYAGTVGTNTTNIWVLKKADPIQGKQTVVSFNSGKHTVDGKQYDDQMCLFMDKAGTITNTTFSWYFDDLGNLIGIGDAHATQFGVITSVYTAMNQGANETTGGVKAIATVRFTDGTTGTVEIDRFLMSWGAALTDWATNNYTPGGPVVTDNAAPGTNLETTAAGAMVAANTAASASQNTIELVPVYDTSEHSPLTTSQANPDFRRSTGSDVATTGWLYASPSTASNTNAHFANPTYDNFRVLYDHMFRFTVANDSAVVATEVAGAYTNDGSAAIYGNVNTNINFRRMANVIVDNGDGDPTSVSGTLYKTLGYMDLENQAVAPMIGGVNGVHGTSTGDAIAAGNNYVYLTSDTQILVRINDGTARRTTINAYTLSTLPGNVEIRNGTEVDWADADGDGRADVVYINGGNLPSTITYGLFYYNGGAAAWDGANRTGTIAGYLNGKEETITVTSNADFDTIQNSAGYFGGLFALQFTNGNVSAVMFGEYTEPGTATTNVNGNKQLLNFNNNSTGTKIEQPFNGTALGTDATISTLFDATPDSVGTNFVVGTAGSNPYTSTTEAVYYYDIDLSATDLALRRGVTNVQYVRVSGGDRIVVTGTNAAGAGIADNYWIAPGATIVGELDWLNNYRCYVTMVYDAANANAITELYITMDPDYTPTDVVTPYRTNYWTVYSTSNVLDTTDTTLHFQNSVRAYDSVSALSRTDANELQFTMGAMDILATLQLTTTDNVTVPGTPDDLFDDSINAGVCYTDLFATAAQAIASANSAGGVGFVNTSLQMGKSNSGYFVARNWIPALYGATGGYVYCLVHVVVD